MRRYNAGNSGNPGNAGNNGARGKLQATQVRWLESPAVPETPPETMVHEETEAAVVEQEMPVIPEPQVTLVTGRRRRRRRAVHSRLQAAIPEAPATSPKKGPGGARGNGWLGSGSSPSTCSSRLALNRIPEMQVEQELMATQEVSAATAPWTRLRNNGNPGGAGSIGNNGSMGSSGNGRGLGNSGSAGSAGNAGSNGSGANSGSSGNAGNNGSAGSAGSAGNAGVDGASRSQR